MERARHLPVLIALASAQPALLGCQLLLRAEVGRAPATGAVAIRDNVSDFEKWGTREFTQEFLRAAYERHWYYTEGRSGLRREFTAGLRAALLAYPAVDIYLLAHSNHYVERVATIEPELRAHIRMVYNTGCGDASQAQRWLELGARAYVAHPGDNLAPIFYYHFLPAWTAGRPLETAVEEANQSTKTALFAGPAGWVLAAIGPVGGKDAAGYWRGTEARIYGNPGLRIDQP
jgi:hypothetical protein